LVKFLKKIEVVFDFLRIHQYKGNESDNFDALVKSNVDGIVPSSIYAPQEVPLGCKAQ